MPSPTVTSRTAAVLTPTPGIDVRTGERGWASSRALIWASRARRCSWTAVRELAREGTTMSRVPVPGTTTVCSSRASKMSSISRWAMRGALGRTSSTSLRRPALRSAAGEP
nr:RecName: Full=Insertion element IS110 uncharacterized 11.7 kDa protein [Streptomyces coelicolor]CAA68493.1 unnamed protein product [Streptomyces coelicolor A3(2)]